MRASEQIIMVGGSDALGSSGMPPPPVGYYYLVDTDGAFIVDTDGAYLLTQ